MRLWRPAPEKRFPCRRLLRIAPLPRSAALGRALAAAAPEGKAQRGDFASLSAWNLCVITNFSCSIKIFSFIIDKSAFVGYNDSTEKSRKGVSPMYK